MTRVRMSKRQVADWLTHAVGLTMYTDKFLANSITGHDLPALLEDGGDHILQDELGITSLLHRKQLRRARLFEKSARVGVVWGGCCMG